MNFIFLLVPLPSPSPTSWLREVQWFWVGSEFAWQVKISELRKSQSSTVAASQCPQPFPKGNIFIILESKHYVLCPRKNKQTNKHFLYCRNIYCINNFVNAAAQKTFKSMREPWRIISQYQVQVSIIYKNF